MSGKTIVLADDDLDLVALLTERCTGRGYSVIGAGSGLEAINVIHRVVPDLVCIDVNMPAGNGLSVCEMMADDERLRAVPVVVLTGNSTPKTIRRCHDMMIYYVEKNADVWSRIEPLFAELLGTEARSDPPATINDPPNSKSEPPNPKSEPPNSKSEPPNSKSEPPGLSRRDVPSAPSRRDKPAGSPSHGSAGSPLHLTPTASSDNTLLDAVFAMLGSEPDPSTDAPAADTPTPDGPVPTETHGDSLPAHRHDPPWVLSIDDDADFSEALKCRLEACGVAVVRAFSGMEGYRMAFTNPASAILLDYNMPNGQGDYILGRLTDNPVTKNIPVIVITGMRDKALERKMYGLGAKRFLTKPVQFDTLRDELANYIEILSEPVAV